MEIKKPTLSKNSSKEVDAVDADRETLFSNISQKLSYGTIDLGKNPKRFWLKTPEGKLVYAHNASEPDSFMERISATGLIANLGRITQVPNALENYFRAIDFIEHNIDFPLGSEDDPIELYSIHKHIFFALTILMFFLNSASFFLGLQRKDTVVDSLTGQSINYINILVKYFLPDAVLFNKSRWLCRKKQLFINFHSCKFGRRLTDLHFIIFDLFCSLLLSKSKGIQSCVGTLSSINSICSFLLLHPPAILANLYLKNSVLCLQ